ncbi:hypothetical protein FACS1894182_09690 [Bacteroidia bacterium]|nr:hypothetical protein FACS1894182_09690 [Bacteroidia bacterium]
MLVLAGFSSCQGVQSVQNQLRIARVDLDYELTSPIYEGNPDKTVYLNFIDNSNMEYFTTVKSSNILVLPFILFNYWHKKFNVILGESALTQPYREFLTDALLAECNRSASFNLKTGDAVSLADAYSLDIKIIQNQTLSGIQEVNYNFIIPTSSYSTFSFSNANYQVLPVVSDLEIVASLKKGKQHLLEKNYTIRQKWNSKLVGNLAFASEQCVFKMTDCLSLTTEQIVTAISRDLDMVLSTQ